MQENHNINSNNQYVALRHKTKLLQGVLTSTSFCFALFKPDGTLVYNNPGFRLLFRGKPTLENATPDILSLVQSAKGEKIYTGKINFYEPGEIALTVEGEVYYENNEIAVIGSVNISDLKTNSENIASQNREINNLQRQLMIEKRKLEIAHNQLKDAQSMLVQSEKMNALGHLVAGVAHEINNPLSFIASNIYNLELNFNDVVNTYSKVKEAILHDKDLLHVSEEAETEYQTTLAIEEYNELLAGASEGVKRIQKIVRDLNQFSRKNQAQLKVVNIKDNIESTLSLIHPELKKRKIETDIAIDPTLNFKIYAGEFNQAIMNILLNSISAIDIDGKIVIEAKEDDKRLILAISDTGEGINSTIIDKIFDPFFTTREPGKGTGLGLAVTHTIITQLHRGKIGAHSTEKKGTTIFIEIPQQ